MTKLSENKKILSMIYEQFNIKRLEHNIMTDYYKGKSLVTTDKGYQRKNKDRSNLITNTNFIKLFIDEEVSYSLGNDISYGSRSGDHELVDLVNYSLETLSESHDINLMQAMLTTSVAYELSYLDNNGDYCAKVIPSNQGHAVLDNFGNVEVFMHTFTKQFDDANYIDVYDSEMIYHYNEKWEQIAEPDYHIFGEVPVGIASWNKEESQEHKTIFAASKGLQDSYETNMSDQTNEISDFRNAYLVIKGADIDDEALLTMKEMGIIQVPEGGEVSWLLKNLNGTFIHDTLTNIENKLYTVNGHINRNENVSDNSSFLAINARNQSLATKCELNQKGVSDCIRFRIKMILKVASRVGAGNYDYRDVFPVFVANLPSDDFSTAEMIAKLKDSVSIETGLSQLSFVKDPRAEMERMKKEQEELYGGGYDLLGGDLDE